MADRFTDDDPPKAIAAPDADGSALLRQPQPPGDAEMLEEATRLPPEDVADVVEQERHDLPAGETMGDAEGSGAGIDIGSGTKEPKPIGGETPD